MMEARVGNRRSRGLRMKILAPILQTLAQLWSLTKDSTPPQVLMSSCLRAFSSSLLALDQRHKAKKETQAPSSKPQWVQGGR